MLAVDATQEVVHLNSWELDNGEYVVYLSDEDVKKLEKKCREKGHLYRDRFIKNIIEEALQ